MFEVYCITSPSGKRYVGFTSIGSDRRWSAHVKDAKSGSVCPLHHAIRKYGPEAFTRSLLERMTTEAGAKRAEQLWIKELGTFGGGYNATLGGEGTFGCAKSPETRAKIGAAGIGRKHSPDARARIAAAQRGKKRSPETRARMSEGARNVSLETRARRAEAGRRRKHSPETLAKMSKSKRGKKLSPEHRAKIAEACREVSDETRAKLSEAQLKRWAKRKELLKNG